jgi:hypothetical protein
MAFTVPVTLKQTGLVTPNQIVTKSTSITQETVTQIQVLVPSGSTDYAINLNILDTSKIKLLSISSSGYVQFKIDNIGDYGWTYECSSMIVLYNDSLWIYDNNLSYNSGAMEVMYVTNNGNNVTMNIVIVMSND